jgi:hypothetical protein
VGRARAFDLGAYTAARANALAVLASALEGNDHSALFKVTETYRAGADGRDRTEHLLRTLYSLLEDLLWILEGAPELVRNTDIVRDLGKLAQSANFAWVQEASDRLAEVERGMRRNLLRSLSLDAFATSLSRAPTRVRHDPSVTLLGFQRDQFEDCQCTNPVIALLQSFYSRIRNSQGQHGKHPKSVALPSGDYERDC